MISRPRAATAPPWVSDMAVGRWYRISGDQPDLGLTPTRPGTRYLEDNDPGHDPRLNPARSAKEILRRKLGRQPQSPWHGRLGFCAITEAWNGAIYACGFGDSGSMIHFGGGHTDYFGSDVHAFDLNTREWSRLLDGYVTGTPDEYGEGAVYPDAIYPDGTPLPPHTYEYVQYHPLNNLFILLKGQLELGPHVKATPIPHMLHLDTLTWHRGPKHESAILSSGGWTAWDASRRLLWGHSGDDGNGNVFIGFNPDGENDDGTCGSWGKHYPNKIPGAANHNTMEIDPVRDILVIAVNAADALYAIDPKDPARPVATLAATGSKPKIHEYAALEYAPNLDAFIYYSAVDRPELHSISAPAGATAAALIAGTWIWQKILNEKNDLDPIEDAYRRSAYEVNKNHTFGRFRVATFGATDLIILVRHVDTPVYALRLT